MKFWETEEFVKDVYIQTKKRLKNEYQTDIIALFHVDDYIEAYLNDADSVSGILGIDPQIKVGKVYMVRFPATDLEIVIDKLTGAGLGVSLSEIRDENGIHYLDAYQEPFSDISDETSDEEEYRQLISYKYKKN